VFVTEYPAATRPFYHMRTEDGSDLTRSFDLLWKGLEVTTGAQREHRYDRLVGQARDRGVAIEPIDYFLDCFRFGCPPHGGFGFGLTRMLMCLLGRQDVRDVTFLHRGRDRLRP
ncbi:MAG TPA: amino acid--tRNA ligase-related protein, partial [Acidimicrobiales bacterium]|nr:amino acid--tRNA ligase-related protein [Acidimicrobiales bacterium]